MKSYVYNSVYNTPYLCTAWEDIFDDFNNIATADNSQSPIFRFDTTAGQLDSDDENSDDDSTEVSSDNDYSNKIYSDDEYDSFDLLSRSYQKVNQAEGRKHTFTPSPLLKEDYIPDYSYNRASRFKRTANNRTKWKLNEEGSWIPTRTDTPPDKCTSKFFGPSPPPDHPQYKP